VRVLHVNDYPLDHAAAGGCEVSIDTIVRSLRHLGADASLEVAEFTIADCPAHRLTPARYLSNPVARAALARTIASFRPDVVHLHNFYHALSPGILATLAAAKRERAASRPLRVVMTAHDGHLVCPNSGLGVVRRGRIEAVDLGRLGRIGPLLTTRWDHRGVAHSALKVAQHLWAYRVRHWERVIDIVICPSRFLTDLMTAHGLPALHLANPVAPASTNGPRPDGPLALVFAGRIGPEKGLAEFLEALPASFDGTLTVVGDGEDADRCRAICRGRGLGGRVTFVGRRPPAEAQAIIARCHVLVLPSRLHENAPVSLLEALSVGTSVVASDRGGMREIVECFGVGHTFDVHDAASLERTLDAVAAEHRAGRLNDFDVDDLLRARDERGFVAGLLEVYGADDAVRGSAIAPDVPRSVEPCGS
jgi:glycosyltransferase involved in cell wall biosynthesis